MSQQTINNMKNQFEDYENNQIKNLGFKPEELSESKRYILLEPVNAPENYHCDGEISNAQAKARWKRKMMEAGFSSAETLRVAIKYGI